MRIFPLSLLILGCRADDKTEFVVDNDEDGIGVDDDCDDANAAVGERTSYFLDTDRDGFGAEEKEACEAPYGHVDIGEDCDDDNAAIYPGAADICDGLDNDCDGAIDNGAQSSAWYVDADGDGFGDDASEIYSCEQPEGFVAVGGDCNDADFAYNPGATEEDCADPNDYNCDGSVGYADDDADGSPACEDCDDADPARRPGADEVCDGLDDDCDGEVDEDSAFGSIYFADNDGDGYGNVSESFAACDPPAGYVSDSTDCDDGRADIHPDASEICNGLDDDCDTLVDDADDSLDLGSATVWYSDADGDGYGLDSGTIVSCDQPAGTAALPGDCDDTDLAYNPAADESDCSDPNDYNCDGSVSFADADGDGWAACEECDDGNPGNYPGAPEICDASDNDCDGDVDESDATDAPTWYADSDGDGFGDSSSSAPGCTAPLGYVADNTDCDDSSYQINPAETEVCNGIDDDCDGLVDESAADEATFYADADNDGYGDPGSSFSSCELPTGYVEDSSDCDDTAPAVNPGQTEICNGVDDNCNGGIDEGVETTWYADADGDSFGDATSTISDCEVSPGYVGNAADCDDSDENTYPGATETYDGADNDCDGVVDNTSWSGTGADGALTVSGTTVIGEAWAVTGISGADVSVAGAPSLATGDEVLMVNMHGSDGAFSHVGNYEFGIVAGVSGTSVSLQTAPAVIFGEFDNSDLAGQAIQIVRVPNYTDVVVQSGGILTGGGWDGSVGGIVAFRASGVVTVETGGLITADELGFWAGETGTGYNNDGFQGESYAGTGDGNLPPSGGYYGNWAAGYYQNNYGGGGAMITGGGGNYGGGATEGASWTGGSYPPAEAGDAYGSIDLSTLFLGSGGAGVWHGNSSPGPGGDGAGIVFISANEILAADASAISSLGGSTVYWATGTWTYGAGGGAGGTIWLVADTFSLAADSVDASGGFGETTHTRVGGDGGYGRIRVDYNVINGNASGSSAAVSAVAGSTAPDAGYAAAP